MTKDLWKGSMKSIENHIDPGKEERMKLIKTESKSQAKKILKLAKNINPGNKDGNLKKKAELINLIEDFHQQHESLYSLYEDLRSEIKKNVNLGPDNDSKNIAKGASAIETSDFLKDKLTSTTEVKKGKPSKNQASEETSKNLARVRDLEQQVESLKLESSKLSTQKRELEYQVERKLNETVQMKAKISKMEARIREIESKYKENESQFCSLRKQFEVKEQEYLSRIAELLTETSDLQLEVNSSRISNKKEMEKIVEENKNLKERVDENDVELREKLCRSENKVRELEKMVEVKEEEMLGLKEEKREAIRQLCLGIDYHQSRSDSYKKMLSEMHTRRKI